VLTLYPVTDAMQLLVSVVGIRKVKAQKEKMKENKDFKEFAKETKERLRDIVYLPIEYESDLADSEDD